MEQNLKINILVNDKSKEAFSRLDKNLGKLKSSIFNLKNAFLGFGAGVVIKGFVDAGIQIENLGVQLTALFGSAKAGQKALQEVTKYAIKTPFELKNIQQGITSLAVVRKTAEEAGISFEELLKITGNTATLLGNDFALASLQVQRSLSAGISSAELFRERGVTAMAGFTAGVRTSALDSAKALKKTFGTGGEFGSLTDELSKTVAGTISNIKDSFFTFQVAVSEGMFGALKSQLGDLQNFIITNETQIQQFGRNIGEGLAKVIVKLGEAVVFARDHFEGLKQVLIAIVLIKIGSFFLTLGAVLYDLTKIVRNLTIAMLANPAFATAGLIVAGIGLITSAILSAKDATDAWANSLEEIDLTEFIGQKIPNKILKDTDSFGFNVLKNPELRQFRGSGKPQFGFEGSPELMGRGGTEQKLSLFEKTRTALEELNNKQLKTFEEKMANIHKIVAEGISTGITKVSESLARSVVLGENLLQSFRALAQQLLINILSALIEQVAIMVIMKLFKKEEIQKEAEKDNLIRKQNSNLKRQIALQAILMAMGGGGGSGLFQGGFGGARASGGTVSKGQPYLVGERGAELFIPNSTGQVAQSARGMGSGQTTVNFNINTLDARGFDELLVRNRGTITQIINSAVNERGAKSLI
jgi:nucleotide-binding universal stress UspA family protein